MSGAVASDHIWTLRCLNCTYVDEARNAMEAGTKADDHVKADQRHRVVINEGRVVYWRDGEPENTSRL